MRKGMRAFLPHEQHFVLAVDISVAASYDEAIRTAKGERNMKTSRVAISKDFRISPIDRRIYGSFVEHLGRCVYGGIYEPGHPSADEAGFRTDVMALVREINPPIVRYPGGNFVSGYDWQDGVGPVEQRPKKWDKAWQVIESNRFGTNEFADWARKAGTEVMMAVNLGTRGPKEAADLVEYCNMEGGTYYSDLRKQHGYASPHGFKTWCLGNEMDGYWQIGHCSADEYGRRAYEAAMQMKWTDPSIELVACGSSGAYMPTFAQWEATVLEHCYDVVEYISLHAYYDIEQGDSPEFMAGAVYMDNYIKTIAATCDYVKAKKNSKKTMYISFDEWNVWFHRRKHGYPGGKYVPRYTLEDMLVFGTMVNSLLRNADRVKIGCQAQLVNVIAPIYTDPVHGAWKQAIFFPYMYASRYGQGISLQAVVDAPTYAAENCDDVPYLDLAVTFNEEDQLTLFAVNRDMEQGMEMAVDLRQFEGFAVEEHIVMYHEDIKAVNAPENPNNILPARLNNARMDGGRLSAMLPKHSWNMIRLKKQG